MKERKELLYQCAQMYYQENKKKNEIANLLGISATQVTRLLKEAEFKGIVKINIQLFGKSKELEDSVKNKFKLKEVCVIKYLDKYEKLKENLGERCALFYEEFSKKGNNLKVGIGGGGSLLSFIEKLNYQSRRIEIYPMSLFGRGPQVQYVDSTFLANYLLIKSFPEAKGFIVGNPPLPKNPEIAKTFSSWIINEIPEVGEVLDQAANVDLAFVGLGAVSRSPNIFREYSKLGITYDFVIKRKAAGGINYNYFDIHGNQIGDGILTINVEKLKKMSTSQLQTVVLVAGGHHKMEAIKIAIKNRMVNVLITDEDTAMYLMDEKNEDG